MFNRNPSEDLYNSNYVWGVEYTLAVIGTGGSVKRSAVQLPAGASGGAGGGAPLGVRGVGQCSKRETNGFPIDYAIANSPDRDSPRADMEGIEGRGSIE
eukprot:1180311-Prorocentrum_minimum.AAC.2